MCACSCRVFWDLLGAVLRPSTQADRASAGRCAGRAGTAQASSAACITCGHNLVLVQLHSSPCSRTLVRLKISRFWQARNGAITNAQRRCMLSCTGVCASRSIRLTHCQSMSLTAMQPLVAVHVISVSCARRTVQTSPATCARSQVRLFKRFSLECVKTCESSSRCDSRKNRIVSRLTRYGHGLQNLMQILTREGG